MIATFNQAEKACIAKLAALFESGVTVIDRTDASNYPWRADNWYEFLGLTEKNHRATLAILERAEVIKTMTTDKAGTVEFFQITAGAVEADRRIRVMDAESAKPPDLVEQLKTTARSHRLLAYAIVAFIVVGGIGTILNQWLGLFRAAGWIR